MPEKKERKGKINPEIVDIDIGVRYLRKVTFYPLSAGHQLRLTSMIEDIFKEMVNIKPEDDDSTVVFFSKLLDIVKENIDKIVGFICDEDSEELLDDMTNSQLVGVVEYVYKTNYEGPLKNLLSLFQREGESNWKELVLNQLSPQSAKPMDTSSTTSIKKRTKKEASA